VTVGLLVDSSGSMREGRERVIAAAGAFAEASHTKDELFALAFNEDMRAALPPEALGYVSSNAARDGRFRRLRVVVTDPAKRSLVVRARDGYRARGLLDGRWRAMERSRIERLVRWLERGFLAVGAICLIWSGTISIDAVAYQVEKSAVLERDRRSLASWSGDGVGAATAPRDTAAPIGRLEIPRLGLSAVVVEGDDENTLQLAVGHLPDTPLPWQGGNAALAGHLDTFFRPLRGAQVGDAIRLLTPHGTFHYRVTRQTIVEPHELWVLNPSPTAALTLITCYPFDFVGPAPQRFVVHAERTSDATAISGTSTARRERLR
jgi:sortase A